MHEKSSFAEFLPTSHKGQHPHSYQHKQQQQHQHPSEKKGTPSQEFMVARREQMQYVRRLAIKNEKQAKKEKDLLLLKLRENPEHLTAAAPMTCKPPIIPPGDVSTLFGPGSTQDREVLPGDFVEIRRNGRPTRAIYLQDFDEAAGQLKSTSITGGDSIIEHRTADVVFRIPGYVFKEKIISRIGHWDPQTNPSKPPPGTGKVALQFSDEAIAVLGVHFTKLNSVYDEFWNKRQTTSLTTMEAAKYVFDKEATDSAPLTLQELYATHIFLTTDSNLSKFIPSVSVRWTGAFTMRSPKDVLVIETVTDWLRKDDARIVSFTEKAKRLLSSKNSGAPESSSSSSSDDVSLAKGNATTNDDPWKSIQFNANDQSIIEFVRQAAFTGYEIMFMTPYMTFLPKLLRPLNVYGDMDAKTAFDFLNGIGIWPRWYNMELNRSAVTLTSGGPEEQAIMDRIRKLHPDSLKSDFDRDVTTIRNGTKVTTSTSPATNPTSVLSTGATKRNTALASPLVLQSATDMYKVDPCDSIRHDFGTQPVYAIDDPSASELDDAFSIESVPVTTLTPQPSTWVHVHVADPTAVLPPFHELSLLARGRVQTTYLPERTYPMLPRELTEGTLSLKNDGQPKKVMTFSARLDNISGDILEYKVRPGIVRNLVTLNYEDVDEHLSWDRIHGGKAEGERVKKSTMTSPVGPPPPPSHDQGKGGGYDAVTHSSILSPPLPPPRTYYRPSRGSVSPNDTQLIQELIQLQKVSHLGFDNRYRTGSVNFSMSKSMVEISPYPLPRVQESQWKHPIDYQSQWQEPLITSSLDPAFASPARIMVSEYMIIAGRVSALFCRDRSIPTLYRNQLPPDEKYRDFFGSGLNKNPLTGMVEIREMLPLRPFIKGAQIGVEPLGHWSLGVHQGYCKVTSPLRRYSDMMGHYQMKAFLLAEKDPSIPKQHRHVYDLDFLTPFANTIRDRERVLGMLEFRSVKFWLLESLRRQKEHGASMIFEGIIMNPTGDGYNVLSTEVGFQCVVKYVQTGAALADAKLAQSNTELVIDREGTTTVLDLGSNASSTGTISTAISDTPTQVLRQLQEQEQLHKTLESHNLKVGDRVLFELIDINPQQPFTYAVHLSAA
ncbi:hypothetical protein BG004_008359 [Podila humilis]|nr:hypothetical protein BG004_008359 [Podila humilis]